MTVVRTDDEANALRQQFFGWQCRLRQHAMRYSAGRPSAGLCPEVYLGDTESMLSRVIVLIIKADAENYSQQFRHMVLKTQDPNERYDAALNYFKAAYYQRGHEFDDRLTALFGAQSEIADRILEHGSCQLHFDQFNQQFNLPCRIEELPEHDTAFQATYWHNRLFNPSMPAGVRILAFSADWQRAIAAPG